MTLVLDRKNSYVAALQQQEDNVGALQLFPQGHLPFLKFN